MGDNYSEDYSMESRKSASEFIHEMTHAGQFQEGQQVLLRGAILHVLPGDPYKADPNTKWENLNIEQQGQRNQDTYYNSH